MKCAILNDYQRIALDIADWTKLQSRAEITVFDDSIAGGEDAVAEALAGFDVIVAMRERTVFGASLFDKLPNLKLLCSTARRNPSIDLAAAAANGVTVCGTDSLFHPTAELTWALIGALTRHVVDEHTNFRSGGHWQTSVGVDLCGKTLGTLGLGVLGQRVAKVAQAFGMHVIAWSNNLKPEICAEHGCEYVDKDGLVSCSDFLTIHTQLSQRTVGLIGAREFAMMKPTAYLINTSRGFIVEEPALIAALRKGRIAGAGLDVFEQEPLPLDHPYRSLPNVVVTPHLGYVTEDSYRLFYSTCVDNILAWLDANPINVMDPTINIDRSK